MNKNYDAIDLFKFIGSIMIFMMHATALLDIGNNWSFALELITRWAVPFFFISSSFFLFLSEQNNLTYACRKYIKRILLLYCAWFIINIPSTFVIRLYGKNLFSINTWLIFLKESILSSTFTGSWFFASCIFSCIFVVYFSRHISTKAILLLTGIFQLLCIFSSVWGGVLPTSIREVLSFLCFPLNITGGCFYFAIGKFMAENKEKVCNFSIRKSIFMLIVCCALYITEVLLAKRTGFYRSTDQSFFVVPFGIFAFITAFNSKLNLSEKSKILRKASTVIFCAQSNLLVVKKLLMHFIHSLAPDFKYTNTVSFLFILCLMLLIVFIVLKLQSKKIKMLSYLT